MRHSGVKVVPAIALAIVAVAAGCSGASGTADTRTGLTAVLVAAHSTRTVSCKSSYYTANGSSGIEKQQFTTFTPSKGLRLYSDQTGRIQPVAAPNGWSCRVVVYGDGSTLLVASAHSVPSSPSLSNLGHISVPMVAFYNSSACGSCMYQISCGAIAAAGKMLGYGPCPQQASDRQRRWTVSATRVLTKVEFSDPVGTKGIGWPSGGKYPVSGVVVYRASGPPAASIETCEAPANEGNLCQTVNASFASLNWQLGSTTGGSART